MYNGDERTIFRSQPMFLKKKESMEYEWNPTISYNVPIYEIGVEINQNHPLRERFILII